MNSGNCELGLAINSLLSPDLTQLLQLQQQATLLQQQQQQHQVERQQQQLRLLAAMADASLSPGAIAGLTLASAGLGSGGGTLGAAGPSVASGGSQYLQGFATIGRGHRGTFLRQQQMLQQQQQLHQQLHLQQQAATLAAAAAAAAAAAGLGPNGAPLVAQNGLGGTGGFQGTTATPSADGNGSASGAVSGIGQTGGGVSNLLANAAVAAAAAAAASSNGVNLPYASLASILQSGVLSGCNGAGNAPVTGSVVYENSYNSFHG
ncbi:unnamed protein product [Protopolystoma xenopodis]|uniref:Uncharacterized protein n=1 Tax=Protopolystoma xenopodis TaxID=117903 RepID=A0A448WCJ4_9PLAT|nr:unnamed protein product [Protopolystoma xenopodis]